MKTATEADELKAKQERLDTLCKERLELPTKIRAAALEDGDGGKRLAELIARRDQLSVLIPMAEAELLEGQIAVWESELPELSKQAKSARDKLLSFDGKLKEMQMKRHGLAKESNDLHVESYDLSLKIKAEKDKLFTLQQQAERELSKATSGPKNTLRSRP